MISGVRETDGRKLTQAEQERQRVQAARLLRGGRTPGEVADALGRSRSWAFGVRRALREGGESVLAAVPRPEGRKKLDAGRRRELFALITHQTPADFGFGVALWTRRIVADVIFERWGVELSLPTVGAVLRDIGLSPQRPLRRALEQDDEAVQRWRVETFPDIRAQARAEGAELYFGDEAGVRSDYHAGTTWAPVGQTPVVEATGNRVSVGMISAISMQGRISFDVVSGRMDSLTFIDFCRKLMADAEGRPVYLIVDNATSHASKKTREFVESTQGMLKLFYLPPYSPQLNPDELVWKNVKHDHLGKSAIRNREDLQSRAITALEYLRRSPEIVKGFFRHPSLAYIAG